MQTPSERVIQVSDNVFTGHAFTQSSTIRLRPWTRFSHPHAHASAVPIDGWPGSKALAGAPGAAGWTPCTYFTGGFATLRPRPNACSVPSEPVCFKEHSELLIDWRYRFPARLWIVRRSQSLQDCSCKFFAFRRKFEYIIMPTSELHGGTNIFVLEPTIREFV
jgi:hypothetical protein